MPDPWNKGKKVPEFLGNQHAFKGNKATPNAARYRARQIKKIEKCYLCGILKIGNRYMVIHHIDGNPYNNKVKNLIVLCRKCHPRVHNRWSKIKTLKQINSLKR